MPPKKTTIEKIKPEITEQRAQPKVATYMQPPSMNKTSNQRMLHNKKTGKRTPMTPESAARWARKYPNEYDVI